MTDSRFIALLLFLFIIPLVSCGSSEQDNGSEVSEQSATQRDTDQDDKKEAGQTEGSAEQAEDTDSRETASVTKEQSSDINKSETPEELDEELIAKGEKVYQEKACSSCHTFGKGRLVGPDLLGVTERREDEWLKKWIKKPDEMLRTDPVAKEMLREYMVPMPNQGLTDEEVVAVLEYMKHKDQTN